MHTITAWQHARSIRNRQEATLRCRHHKAARVLRQRTLSLKPESATSQTGRPSQLHALRDNQPAPRHRWIPHPRCGCCSQASDCCAVPPASAAWTQAKVAARNSSWVERAPQRVRERAATPAQWRAHIHDLVAVQAKALTTGNVAAMVDSHGMAIKVRKPLPAGTGCATSAPRQQPLTTASDAQACHRRRHLCRPPHRPQVLPPHRPLHRSPHRPCWRWRMHGG